MHPQADIENGPHQKLLEKYDDEHEDKGGKVNHADPCGDYPRNSIGYWINELTDCSHKRVVGIWSDPRKEHPNKDDPEIDGKKHVQYIS